MSRPYYQHCDSTILVIENHSSHQAHILAGVSDLKRLLAEATRQIGDLRDSQRVTVAVPTSKESSSYSKITSISSKVSMPQDSPRSFGGSDVEGSACSWKCTCRCHCQVHVRLGLSSWHYLTGSVTVRTVGNVLNSSASACDSGDCRQRSTPKLLVVFILPRWLVSYAVAFVYRGGPSPSFTLCFPRVVPPDAKIAIAIRAGDTIGVQQLISNGEASPLDIVGPYGFTALKLAVSYGHTETAGMLISMGAYRYPAKITGRVGDIAQFWTKLSRARCSISSTEVIQDGFHLCSSDGYVNVIPSLGTAFLEETLPLPRLHKCVLGLTQEVHEEVIRRSRPCIDDIDSLGRTALHWATCQNNTSMVNQLLQCGANPDIRDNDEKAPLHLAAGFGHIESVSCLIEGGADLHAQDTIQNTPMHVATLSDQSAIVLNLAQAGADIERTSGLGETPLLSACLNDAHDCLKILLALGANPEKRCNWGCSALGRAVKVGAHRALKLLLDHGVRTDTVRHDEKTLLHLAAISADLEMFQILIEARVGTYDVEKRDEDGMTAFEHLCLRRDAADVMEPFLRLCDQASMKSHDVSDEDEEEEVFFDAAE